MKRKLVIPICFLLCSSVSIVSAQVSYRSDKPEEYFERGKKMFEMHNYVGCEDQLCKFKEEATDDNLIQEADFLIAMSAFERKKSEAIHLLQKFVRDYPWSNHVCEAGFNIGNYYFFDQDYKRASKSFEHVDVDKLSQQQQEEYYFRLGLSYLQIGQKEKAKPFFAMLTSVGTKYRSAAIFYFAYIQYVEKEYEKALSGFAKVENNSEFGASSSYYMTQIYFINRNYNQVIKQGLKLLSDYPDHSFNTEIYRLLGESYYQQGNDIQTISYLTSYVSAVESPERSSLYMLGISEYRTGHYKEAINYLSRTTNQEDALMQNAYLYLAQSYLKLGDQKNARLSFDVASRFNFDSQVQETALYNYALSIHETSFSPFDESVVVFEKFLNTFPSSRYADQINDYLVEVYLTTKNYRAALVSIDKIKQPTTKIIMAKQRILFQLGTEFFANSQLDKAQKYFTDAISLGNSDPEAKAQSYFWRGECYYRLGEYARAAADYRQYLSSTRLQDKDIYGLAQYDLAYSYFKQHDFGQALQWFRSYTQRNSQNKSTLADAYNRIGDCYFSSRQFSAANEAYEKSISLLPEAGDYALFQKGFVSGLQQDYRTKIVFMDRLITDFPRSEYMDDALFEKGHAYVMQKNMSSAIESFERLLKDFPHSPVTRKGCLQLALVYYNNNQADKSIAAYKRVISDFPGSDEAQVAAEDLKSVYVDRNNVSEYAEYIKSLKGQIRFEAGEQDSLTYLAAEKQFLKGDKKQGEKSLINYLQSFPDGAFMNDAHYYLAMYNADNKNYTGALSHFDKVLQHPDSPFGEESLIRVAEIETTEKKFENALKSYKALELRASNAENKLTARLGILRMSVNLGLNQDIILIANRLLEDGKLSPELRSETLFERALALRRLNQNDKAVQDFKVLAEDTRTLYGAEAAYLLGQYYYDNSQLKESEKETLKFIENGTSHQYWLARAFILLSDISLKQKDAFQAKQYLLSLKNNYTGKDDIGGMIEQRLKQIGK